MSTAYNGEGQQGPVVIHRPLLRVPHVITDLGEVHAAVERLQQYPHFVVDVETTKERAQTNTLLWVGLGGPGHVALIPCGHPKGVRLTPEHKEKTPACLLYPEDDPRAYTPTGKPSFRMVEHTVPATYADPPKQLFADEVLDAIRPLLFSDRGKIGHHVKFDLESIAKYYGEIPPGPYHDTIVVRHVLDEELQDYGLKALTCERYEIPLHKRAKFYPELGKLGVVNYGLDEVAVYLAKDLRYCWLMFQKYWPQLVRKGLQGVYDFEMSLYPAIMGIEQAGFPVDKSALDRVRSELEDRIAEIEAEAWRIADGQFQLSHTDSKRWVMFGRDKPGAAWRPKRDNELTPAERRRTDEDPKERPWVKIKGSKLKTQRLKPLSFTEKDKVPQITQAVLEYYAERNEMARLLLEWSVMEKLRGTFVEGIDSMLNKSHDGLPTIHTSFKQHGTVTGRFSATEPNLQQIPRGSTIRDLFVAGPGNVLIVADYDQVELRCLGYESGDPTMLEIFQRGDDIHSEAAAVMYEVALEMVDDMMRQTGKTVNFGTAYGASAPRVAAVAKVAVARGQEFLDRYYARFSELLPWKRQLLKEAREARERDLPPHVVIPPFGRLRRLPDLINYFDGEDWMRQRAERQAVNAKIQGFASYITKMAMLQLHEDLAGYPARMTVQVHDEIVFQVEKSYVDEVLPLVINDMSGIKVEGKPVLGKIPLVVSAKVGYSWGEAKSAKKAAVLT